MCVSDYRQAKLLIWRLASSNLMYACLYVTLSIQIAKSKFCQYQLNTVLPNLMLAKIQYMYIVYRCTVCLLFFLCRLVSQVINVLTSSVSLLSMWETREDILYSKYVNTSWTKGVSKLALLNLGHLGKISCEFYTVCSYIILSP